LGERRGEEIELLTSAKAMRASICFIGEKLHGDMEKQVAGSLSDWGTTVSSTFAATNIECRGQSDEEQI